jgi:hypothetical protein
MKLIAHSYRGVSALIVLNMDRFLIPLLVMGALTIAGWLFSYATVH